MTHRFHHAGSDGPVRSLNRAFVWGIALNVAFVAFEAAMGFLYDSVGLLSDAGHNLTDVAGLLLALAAFRLERVHAAPRYTYGYRKSTVLISLLNSLLLLLAVGVIVAEAIRRLIRPEPVEGGVIVWTAGAGIAVNGLTAWLFMKDKKRDLNVRGAFLHMVADALVSVGVLVSGLVIGWTGWTIVDPVVGLVVAGVIVGSVWSLLRDSLRLSLDGVPRGIDPGELTRRMLAAEGVLEVHHLHVWAISTTQNALTAHVVIASMAEAAAVKAALRERLAEAGVGHVTLEFETKEEGCCGCCD